MNYSESKIAFGKLFANELDASDATLLLTRLYHDGESVEQIRAATEIMRENSIQLSTNKHLQDRLIDNCGTGGDKSGSFNISTTVSIVLASLGCHVAKHGNRSITSNSGSADMLEALGVRLDLNLEQKNQMLEECGFAFLFAQNHHPAMRHIMPIRKSLPHRSIFNILGPLTNPAGVKRHLIGVFDYSFAPKMAKVLQETGSKKGYIVHSNDGLDELSVCDFAKAVYFDEHKIEEIIIEPTELGFKRANKIELLGGDAIENAKISYELLQKKESSAKKDIVILNCAFALISSDFARDAKDGIQMATEAIDSGNAFSKLQQIIKISNKL